MTAAPSFAAPAAGRLPMIDLLKAVAAQLIVLHHLAFYGPMSDVVATAAPQLIEWLSRQGRLAVQVFLVVGGFLAARQLAPEGRLVLRGSPWAAMRDRYLRLVLPYAAMLVFVLACAALARRWLDHPSVPAAADGWDLLAHLLLLQDLLDIDALSAGVWYIAIDFQLFVMFLGALCIAARAEPRFGLGRSPAVAATAAMVLASLLHFNRDAGWDEAAPYFFGAYGAGALAAWWIAAPGRLLSPRLAAALLLGSALALGIDYRPRIALAVAVALAIALAAPRAQVLQGRAWAVIRALSRTSYSLFLVHFGVCLVVNALFVRFLPATVPVQGLGLLLAWAASLAAAALFHRWIEAPALAWVAARPRRAASALGA